VHVPGHVPRALLLWGILVLGVQPALLAQQPPPKITEIIVVGNKVLNRESIVSASGLKIGDPVTQASLDEAKRRLMQTGNFGIHSANPDDAVKIQAEVTGQNAKVVIDVDENDVVKGINLTGTGPIPPAVLLGTPEHPGLIQTKVGNILNLPILQQDLTRITDYYRQKGYEAMASEDLGMKDGILNIPLIVAKVQSVRINGLHKTKPYVVLREMHQKQGAYFNVNELREDVTRLLNTDLFEDVAPAISAPSPGKVDITLNITEKRTGSVELAIGYGNQGGLVGRAGISDNNFMGRDQQVSFLWETGGLANRNSFELGFTEPWLDKRNTSLSVSLFDKTVYRFSQQISSVTPPTGTSSSDYYYETHTGGQITVSRPFSKAYRGFVGFRYDDVRVPALALSVTDSRLLQNGPLTVLNLRVTHNTRDLDLEPATGGYEIYQADIGRADLRPVITSSGTPAPGVFGILNYTRLAIDARRYFSPQGRRKSPKDKRQVFALRLMLGTSTGTLPFSEQWFIGGAETLRGYREDRFWGSNEFLASVEFRQPLANNLTGVLFVDAGDAWGGPYESVKLSDFTQHSGFSPSVGFGLGLRVITPIGPIRIDEGFGREGAQTHFSIGHVF